MQETDHRPWGKFTILGDDDDHKVKRLTILPQQRLSLQRHQKRREHWLIVSGGGMMTVDERQFELHPGDSVDIPMGAVHRVYNHTKEELVFIEIQLGEYFGEDDIERLEDDYDRS